MYLIFLVFIQNRRIFHNIPKYCRKKKEKSICSFWIFIL